MQKQTIALLAGALLVVATGTVLAPQWFADDEVPVVRWEAKDEVEVDEPAGTESGELATEGAERTAVVADPAAGPADEARVALILRGRVVDKYRKGVEGATIWLDFGRGGPRGGGPGGGGPGGRQRRVPDPVQSDREGRFAFQGQAFRSLRVSLQVAHRDFAAGLFDKDLGEVTAEVDLGDLVLTNGGEVLGRVTDLEGNGIAGARVEFAPENDNRMRNLRNRENLIAALATDNNGFYRRAHVAAGEWTAGATAKQHTEGRSPAFVVEEDQLVEVDDIRLGPGFEITGYVRDTRGQPIAKADVTLRGQNQNRGRPGRPGGPGQGPAPAEDWRALFGREHSATTDDQGRFFLEHLPGVPSRLETRADGYLDFAQDAVDPALGQPLHVTMQDGLRIAGTVTDAVDGQKVALFAVRATRLRGLPAAGQTEANLEQVVAQLRNGSLDDATRNQLRTQVESLRAQVGAEFRRGGRDGGGPGGGRGNENDRNGGGRPGAGRDLGKPEPHPDGAFVVTGLQEGIYEVAVQSPDHARFRSQEVEVRLGLQPPTIAASLDRGVYVAGTVTSDRGAPIANARVEMRAAGAPDGGGRGRRGGGRPGANGETGNGFDLEALAREFQRAAGGVTLEATTDAEGVFVIRHAGRGSYRLTAQARGFATANSENFDLQADRSGFQLQLGALGALVGTVRGLREAERGEARVAAVPIGGPGGFGGMMRGRGGNGGPGGGGGPFQSASVQADGSYRLDDLMPGDYVVRSWVGSPQDLMREMGAQFLGGTIPADVQVKGGEVARFDLLVTRPQIGEVAGTVLHNGRPPSGFRVELTRLDESGTPQAERGGRGPGGGPGGGRGAMFGGGRTFSAAVAASGRFAIADVPAGQYRLRVQAGRRGGLLHEETVQVVADATTERDIPIATASLRGSITRDDQGDPKELAGSATLARGLTALPENWQAWRREPGNATFDARVQNGAFLFETLKPDNYLLVLTVRGRERTTVPVVVTASGEQNVVVAAGKVAAAPSGSGQPGAGNGGSGAGRARPNGAGATPQPGSPTRR